MDSPGVYITRAKLREAFDHIPSGASCSQQAASPSKFSLGLEPSASDGKSPKPSCKKMKSATSSISSAEGSLVAGSPKSKTVVRSRQERLRAHAEAHRERVEWLVEEVTAAASTTANPNTAAEVTQPLFASHASLAERNTPTLRKEAQWTDLLEGLGRLQAEFKCRRASSQNHANEGPVAPVVPFENKKLNEAFAPRTSPQPVEHSANRSESLPGVVDDMRRDIDEFKVELRAEMQREIDAFRASYVARMGNEQRDALKAELLEELRQELRAELAAELQLMRADMLASLRVQLGAELTAQFEPKLRQARVDVYEAMSKKRAEMNADMQATVEHVRSMLSLVGEHMAEAKDLERKHEAFSMAICEEVNEMKRSSSRELQNTQRGLQDMLRGLRSLWAEVLQCERERGPGLSEIRADSEQQFQVLMVENRVSLQAFETRTLGDFASAQNRQQDALDARLRDVQASLEAQLADKLGLREALKMFKHGCDQ